MRKLLLLAAVFAAAGCAHSKPTPAPAPAAPAPLADSPAPLDGDGVKALSAEQLAQFQKAQALREEGLRLLYAKDPRVKNPQKAFEKLLEAAKLGDPLAMDSVGGMYSSGQAGAERSCARAMEWFEKSAASGYGLAANNLAYLYVTCDDKKRRDPEKAETILRLMFANNPSMIAVLDTYAALLAEQGNFKTAASTMQVVIELQELIESNPERIDESKHALALYRKHKKLAVGFDAKPETDQPVE
ncbi:MAG: tetratricopeptide repeat protein [Bdellovibrionota bacterium]